MSMKRPARRALSSAASVLLACLAGCGSGAEPRDSVEPFVLSPVLATQLAAYEPALEAPAMPEPAKAADVRGLATARATGSGAYRDFPLEDVKQLGPAAIQPLSALLLDANAEPNERVVAAELLAHLDHPVAREKLLAAAMHGLEPWVRSYSAYYLAQKTPDHHLPDLVLRFKYEKDPAAYCWIAIALARLDNFTGVPGLIDLAGRVEGDVQATAAEALRALEERLGKTPQEIVALWNSHRATELPQRQPSDKLRARLWQTVSKLTGEHFQLRGVDDGRFALTGLGAWAALELAPALGEDDVYVRLHIAQVLERMGPRAVLAGPDLLRALTEPQLAPAAAEALGRVGIPEAEPLLRERLTPSYEYELRVACARALGRLGLPASAPALIELFDATDDPALQDLRLATSTALVLLDEGDRAAHYLHEVLLAGGPPSAAAATALETWLVRGKDQGRTGFSPALADWRKHDPPPGTIPDTEKAAKRRAARAEALAAHLGILAPAG